MKAWTDMTPREKNNLIAEKVMGWKSRHEDLWDRTNEMPAYTGERVIRTPFVFFHPVSDPVACRLVEDEIERRGSATIYGRILRDIVWSGEYPAYEYPDAYTWALIRATSEQRCEAAWRACGGTE